MLTETRKLVLSWIALIALLVGFGFFTNLIWRHFQGVEAKLSIPARRPPEPTEPRILHGPGYSHVKLWDGMTHLGVIVGLQKPNPARGLRGEVRIEVQENNRRVVRTFFWEEIEEIYVGTERASRGKLCVFKMRSRGQDPKTLEAWLVQETASYYEVDLLSGQRMRLDKKDVIGVDCR